MWAALHISIITIITYIYSLLADTGSARLHGCRFLPRQSSGLCNVSSFEFMHCFPALVICRISFSCVHFIESIADVVVLYTLTKCCFTNNNFVLS